MPPTLTMVARAAAQLYRRHLIGVVVIAFVVFTPIDLAETVVDDLTNELELPSLWPARGWPLLRWVS